MMLLLRCPQKACVVEWAGHVVPSPYSAISGCHDGDLVSLTRREVNAQNASMKSASCSISTATPGAWAYPSDHMPLLRQL